MGSENQLDRRGRPRYGFLAAESAAEEVAYDPAGRLLSDFEDFCHERGFPFERHLSIRSPDDSTLFCIAGMQRYKALFRDPSHTGIVCGVQRCLRLDDLDELGDDHHWLSFDMLGMFGFRSLGVEQTIELWLDWLHRVGISPDVVTVHPDRSDWARFYRGRSVEVRPDPGCTWSDGETGGYCTEMYVGGLELGNIVNPLGDCIDVGFGLDRLGLLCGDPPPTREDSLRTAVLRILEDGVRPGNKAQGYVLRRLLRRLVRDGIDLDHPELERERERQERARRRYERLRVHHPDASPEWWWKTHGIEVEG